MLRHTQEPRWAALWKDNSEPETQLHQAFCVAFFFRAPPLLSLFSMGLNLSLLTSSCLLAPCSDHCGAQKHQSRIWREEQSSAALLPAHPLSHVAFHCALGQLLPFKSSIRPTLLCHLIRNLHQTLCVCAHARMHNYYYYFFFPFLRCE